MDRNVMQIDDKRELLDQMMMDMEHADELYRPTNYWSYYQKYFLPELSKKGLKDFRRRKQSVLGSFGATDIPIFGRIKIRGNFRGKGKLEKILNNFFRMLPFFSLEVLDHDSSETIRYFYHRAKHKFNRKGLDISRCPTSKYGNPEDLLEIDGGLWSKMHLQYCSMFADAAEFVPFNDGDVFCELGPGLGRNIEILAQLYKNSTFIIFDIPPQLYVANQYLNKVFGSRIIQYKDAITLMPDSEGTIPQEIKSKIIILPTWRMPEWAHTRINIFWNSASFQEMEPDVVINYLKLVKKMNPKWIYINALPQGNYWGEWHPGRGGTKLPVTDNLYFSVLQDSYTSSCTYSTEYFLRGTDYKSYIFKHKDGKS